MAIHNEVGKKGEEIGKNFLQSNGFEILMTNAFFGKKEIDIISEKDNIVRLVEIKTTHTGSNITSEDNFTKQRYFLAVIKDCYFFCLFYPHTHRFIHSCQN